MGELHSSLEKKTRDPFKSEGERQIALLLERLGIPYRYEYPLAILDRGKVRLWYPDFVLPEYGIVLEYAGMEGNGLYDSALRHKKDVYAELGLSVIYVEPETFRGFWPRKLAEGIESVLAERLDAFRKKMSEEFSRQDTGRSRQPSKSSA